MKVNTELKISTDLNTNNESPPKPAWSEIDNRTENQNMKIKMIVANQSAISGTFSYWRHRSLYSK